MSHTDKIAVKCNNKCYMYLHGDERKQHFNMRAAP